MPIDQAHEQANKMVKGAGGMIGLTEHQKMLERWAIYVPELNRILEILKVTMMTMIVTLTTFLIIKRTVFSKPLPSACQKSS